MIKYTEITCDYCGKKASKRTCVLTDKNYCSQRCSITHLNKTRTHEQRGFHSGSIKDNITKIIPCIKCGCDLIVKLYDPGKNKFCVSCKILRYEEKAKEALSSGLLDGYCEGCNILIRLTLSKKTLRPSLEKKYCDKCKLLACQKGGLKSVQSQSISRRSKNEIYFAELCQNKFSNILTNSPIFDGWDADVILEDQKIAVLWNGVWHYKQVREAHSVDQVQSRDKIKLHKIENAGYTPYVIKDDGKFNKKFVEEQFNIFTSWLEERSNENF